MSAADQDHPVSTQPSPNGHEIHRRVSIAENHGLHGHDNPAFDSPRSRKVSAASDHAEMGPVRKKSILHHAHASENISLPGDTGKHYNGDARSKKHSVTDSIHSKKSRFSEAEDEKHSWWYSVCLKCNQQEDLPAWQPAIWPRICPHPFCPSYRQFSRILAVALIFLVIWAIMYSLMGDIVAPPHGKVYTIIFLSVFSFLGGAIFSITTLPPLIGMLLTGLLFQNVGFVNLDDSYTHLAGELRKMALVIILIKAGLDLDPDALKRLKFAVLKLGLVPWTVEAIIVGIMSHYLLGLPWLWGFGLGSIIAAVSPAVVVASLVRIRSKGYGAAKGIPTLIIAVSGIDDALSVAVFGIIKSFIASTDSLSSQIIHGPASIIGGIGFGILWGVISNYAPERHDPFVVPMRIILLLVGGMVAVFGSDVIGFEGAGPLAAVTLAFVSIVYWTRQGWDIEDNPAITSFEIFWIIIQPVLFGVTGAQIRLNELDGSVVAWGFGILIVGILTRILSTVVVGIGCNLNLKEKLFVSLCWMSKATVQAALGPMLISVAADELEMKNAEAISMISVLSIILTAPMAAMLITVTGPRLLTKTTIPHIPEGWKRSHRPSIRDISIIDEEEEKDDNIEAGRDSSSYKDVKHHT